MIIISGPPPGPGGMGRLMAGLEHDASQSGRDVRFIYGPAGTFAVRALRRGQIGRGLGALWRSFLGLRRLASVLGDASVLEASEPVVLMHFQTLGNRWLRRFVAGRKNPTWLFLADSAHFCVRNFNFIEGETTACLRCVGGNFTPAAQHRCPPYPVSNRRAACNLLTDLRGWVASGRIKLLAQTRLQAQIARRHFGPAATIRVIGLWTVDMPVPFVSPAPAEWPLRREVVYHGSAVPGKGCFWSMELALLTPELSFLFPYSWREVSRFQGGPPKNCRFKEMTWETGLADVVRRAQMVLAPSLWSAPVEGALIKSILYANAVAVVNELTGFSSQVPGSVVLRLPSKPSDAAESLRHALATGWQPDKAARAAWLSDFEAGNRHLLERMANLNESLIPD